MVLKKDFLKLLVVVFALVVIITSCFLFKSLLDYSHTGPPVREAVMQNFVGYTILAMIRLLAWVALITSYLTGIGGLCYWAWLKATGQNFNYKIAFISSSLSFIILVSLQFSRHLLYIPASLIASFNYRNSRLYPLWELLTPERLQIIQWTLLSLVLGLLSLCLLRLLWLKYWGYSLSLLAQTLSLLAIFFYATQQATISTDITQQSQQQYPNIVMIGADTLRADRLGAFNYSRQLTPFIDSLATKGSLFTNFFVPIARTAPSLTTFMTGTWPHTHKIRDNYSEADKLNLAVASLPEILKKAGYRSEVVTDWVGGDFKKIQFGFDKVDSPEDQWNLKYLISQGPKDIRLFLKLFTHNYLGKRFLPELYYLAGTPLAPELAATAKQRLSILAKQQQPFFLTIFSSNTHIPFAAEYPYYQMFSDSQYSGESKFSMSGLTTPSEIINKQAQQKYDFDLKQVIALYDGCVRSFDDFTADIVGHINKIGLMENTIIVIFSDHGVDLFERHTWGQGNSVLGNEPSARVPLIIVNPKQPSVHIIEHTTRAVDFAPTLLSLINLPIPETMEGVSLLPYLQDKNIDLELTSFFETGVWLTPLVVINKQHLRYPNIVDILEIENQQSGALIINPYYRESVMTAKDRMLRTDRWKLVYLPMKTKALYWLFDLKNDPNSKYDVSTDYPHVFKTMKTKLHQWMSQDKHRTWKNEHFIAK